MSTVHQPQALPLTGSQKAPVKRHLTPDLAHFPQAQSTQGRTEQKLLHLKIFIKISKPPKRSHIRAFGILAMEEAVPWMKLCQDLTTVEQFTPENKSVLLDAESMLSSSD